MLRVRINWLFCLKYRPIRAAVSHVASTMCSERIATCCGAFAANVFASLSYLLRSVFLKLTLVHLSLATPTRRYGKRVWLRQKW